MNQNFWLISQSYIKKYDKVLKFLIGGIFITILQVVLLYLFTHTFKAWYLFSAQLSFTIAFLVSFVIYRDWVFPGGEKASHHQFVLYTILTIMSFFVNGLGVFVFVDWLGIWYVYSQIIVKALMSIANYFLYNIIIFNK